MRKLVFVVTYLAIVTQVLSSERLMVDELTEDFLELEDELWKFILSQHGDNSVDPGITVIRKLYDFDQKVKKMPEEILHGMQVVRELKSFLLLYSDIRVIHDMYEKFRRYEVTNLIPKKKDYSLYNRQITTSDMVDDILHDENNNVNATLEKVFLKLFGSNTNNMIWELFEITSSDNYNCKYDQPSQQVAYNLYNTIALINLKGYIMMQFAYLAKRLQEKGNNTETALLAREQYKIRANNTLSTLRGLVEIMNNKKWMCDPKRHIEGETFIQVTRLLQGHIQNEVDLNSRGTCRESCGVYSMTQSYGCFDSDSDYCKKRKPCNGRILNCRFVESHLTACIAPPSSLRRYEYVEYQSGKVLGKKNRCQNRNINSWFRWFVHCSYCLCLCDEQGASSDRYFNVRPVMADVENNRVVTGLRLIKHNRIIHLQIQEGKLLPYGYINNSTVKWVPVDDYKITEKGITNGADYYTMTYESRSLLLDELAAHESNHVITGVRFEYIGGHLRFQINVRSFDFKSGILGKDSHYVYGNGFRSRIDLDHSEIPTSSPPSEPDWDTNRYVEFTHTDFKKDMAQTTIPFIDSQAVTINPQVPLRGAGIYYKSINGYGGFIAPSITAYDFSQHMKVKFPDPPKREDLLEYLEVLTN